MTMASRVVTASPVHGVCARDKLKFSGDTNRMRRTVVAVINSSSFNTDLHLRPSRGYARHVRRSKQLERKP